MIDRRRFVQSMIAFGAAASLHRADILLAAPPAGELRDLADAALASAKKAGATYADIRINRYRNQFIFTRDRTLGQLAPGDVPGQGQASDGAGRHEHEQRQIEATHDSVAVAAQGWSHIAEERDQRPENCHRAE